MRTIDEIMTRNPALCVPETRLVDVAKLMVEHDCGEIPVVNNMRDKRPVGVITDRDITCRSLGVGKEPSEMTARDCMSSPVISVFLREPLEEALRTMVFKKIRRIPVIDEKGVCCGILSQADIAGKVDNSLVGELLSMISEPTKSPSNAFH